MADADVRVSHGVFGGLPRRVTSPRNEEKGQDRNNPKYKGQQGGNKSDARLDSRGEKEGEDRGPLTDGVLELCGYGRDRECNMAGQCGGRSENLAPAAAFFKLETSPITHQDRILANERDSRCGQEGDERGLLSGCVLKLCGYDGDKKCDNTSQIGGRSDGQATAAGQATGSDTNLICKKASYLVGGSTSNSKCPAAEKRWGEGIFFPRGGQVGDFSTCRRKPCWDDAKVAREVSEHSVQDKSTKQEVDDKIPPCRSDLTQRADTRLFSSALERFNDKDKCHPTSSFRPQTAHCGYRTISSYSSGFGKERLGHIFHTASSLETPDGGRRQDNSTYKPGPCRNPCGGSGAVIGSTPAMSQRSPNKASTKTPQEAASEAMKKVKEAVEAEPDLSEAAQKHIYASEFFSKHPCIAFLPWQTQMAEEDGEEEKVGNVYHESAPPDPVKSDKFTQTERCTSNVYTYIERQESDKNVGTETEKFDVSTNVNFLEEPDVPSLRSSRTSHHSARHSFKAHSQGSIAYTIPGNTLTSTRSFRPLAPPALPAAPPTFLPTSAPPTPTTFPPTPAPPTPSNLPPSPALSVRPPHPSML